MSDDVGIYVLTCLPTTDDVSTIAEEHRKVALRHFEDRGHYPRLSVIVCPRGTDERVPLMVMPEKLENDQDKEGWIAAVKDLAKRFSAVAVITFFEGLHGQGEEVLAWREAHGSLENMPGVVTTGFCILETRHGVQAWFSALEERDGTTVAGPWELQPFHVGQGHFANLLQRPDAEA